MELKKKRRFNKILKSTCDFKKPMINRKDARQLAWSRLDQSLKRLKSLISAGCLSLDWRVVRYGVSYIQEQETQVISHLSASL